YEKRTAKEVTPLRTQPYAKKPSTLTKQTQFFTIQSNTKQLRTPTVQTRKLYPFTRQENPFKQKHNRIPHSSKVGTNR
ncbi:14776_t:CDS:1, partial [Acaulospora morrowiae]